MNTMWQNLLNSRWPRIASSWVLGFTFIYASSHKIADPAAFAKIVYGYGLFPDPLINLIAITLPFAELMAGLALIFGLWRRSAAIIIVGMLVIFILIISINLARGYEFDCGCFSESAGSLFFLSGSPRATLVRDIFLLILGIFCLRTLKEGSKKMPERT